MLFPIVLLPILAYTRVYMCVLFLFSLSIIFSIVIGNIRNRCKESLEWLKFLCFRGSCWFASIETFGNEFVFPWDSFCVSHRKQYGGRLFVIKSHSFVRVSCKGEIECWGKLVRHGLYQKHNGKLQYCGKIARL